MPRAILPTLSHARLRRIPHLAEAGGLEAAVPRQEQVKRMPRRISM
jgi:hypothetical protein